MGGLYLDLPKSSNQTGTRPRLSLLYCIERLHSVFRLLNLLVRAEQSMTTPHYCILDNRAVLAVSGDDRVSFLQGLVSNDVERVSSTQAVWAAFLTPQGKFLHEFMIAEHGERLLLDCEAERRDDLLTRLKRFRLRSKVDITVDDSLSVAVAWGDTVPSMIGLPDQPGNATQIEGGVLFRDPRLMTAGARCIAPTGSIESLFDAASFTKADASAYDAHRIRQGLPDGSRDLQIDKALLLENGFEELGGVDFQKGCYIGQELTARTHYRALIKKRLIPVSIDGEAPAPGTSLSVDGKEAGEMKTSGDGYGLALVRLAQWRASTDGTLSAGNTTLRPEPAPWMVLPQDPEA